MFPLIFCVVVLLHPVGLAFAVLASKGLASLLGSIALLYGMALTYSVGVQTKTPEGTIANTTESFNGNVGAIVDAVVPAATVDQVEACSVKVANLVMCILFSPLAVTIKTYEAGVLKQTMALAAGKQLVWDQNSTFANPFTDDFDTMKISNADVAKSTTVKARFLSSN